MAFLSPIDPAGARISSLFGRRDNPFGENLTEGHDGIDFAVPAGTPVYAADAGTVVSAGGDTSTRGAGLLVGLKHKSGLTTHYFHLNQPVVSKGEAVARGQVIGVSGSTGRSTGPHLHFETRDAAGKKINPLNYLADTYTLKPDLAKALGRETITGSAAGAVVSTSSAGGDGAALLGLAALAVAGLLLLKGR